MSVEDAFLHDICANPDDVALRLVYADWLDDRGGKGDADRAEFIRLQCRPGDSAARQKELLHQWGKAWHKPFKGLFTRWEFRCGFIERVTMKAMMFIEQGESILARTPLRHVKVRDPKEHVGELAKCPALARLEMFNLNFGHMAGARAAKFFASPHLGKLRILDLGNNNIGQSGARSLASAAPLLKGLRRLALDDNKLGDTGAATVLSSPLLGQLSVLNLEGNDLTDATLDRLAQSPAAAGLVQLHLGRNNYITLAGFTRMLRSEPLRNLRKVYAHSNFAIIHAIEALRQEFGSRVEINTDCWDAKVEDGPAAGEP